MLEQAVGGGCMVRDVRLLGAPGTIGVHDVDGERITRAPTCGEGDRLGVPRDGRAAHIGPARQSARGQVHRAVSAGHEGAREWRRDDLREMERRPTGKHVEVLRAVRRGRYGAADVRDLADGSRHALHALPLVPLVDHTERRDRVDRGVVVVVVAHVAERAARQAVAEVLEERAATVDDAVGAVEYLRAVEVLAHQTARADVVALEGHLRDREGVVSHRGGEGEAPRRAASEAIVVEHRRRVALRHHAALLHQDGLHLLGEKEEGRVEALVGRCRVLLRPLEERLVVGVLDGREERAAFVVAPPLRRRERSAHDLGLLRSGGEVVARRKVVPADLLRRVAAGEVERVDGRPVAIATGARRREQRLRRLLERRPVSAPRVGVRVETGRARDGVRAGLARDVDRRIAGVVGGRAVLDPAA